MEALRIKNYPYQAIEEAVVNVIVFVHLQMITTMMVVDILLSVLKKKTE